MGTFSKFKKTITKYQNKKNNSARTRIKRTFNTSKFFSGNDKAKDPSSKKSKQQQQFCISSSFKQLKNRNIQKSISLMIPFKELIENLKKKNVLSNSNRPKANTALLHYPNFFIIQWFNNQISFLLNLYCCCQNFNKVRIFIDRI